MAFRIAIGPCKCVKPYRAAIQKLACEILDIRLAQWRGRLPQDLAALPGDHYELEHVEGHRITFATHKRTLPDESTLVVFSALVHTLSWPTFISLGAVGRCYAEGLLVAPDGKVEEAPDAVMWEFR
jgi:hypothetical protein